ncbi:Uncharacterized protein HZ326_15600 [Fusarium oxysporum f. sp. albedinis]|nr:Uncharacterized protein HZ326_15600 [Fusarium oxysporum f. sp. albedinis]
MIFRTLGGITKPRWVNLSLGGAGSTAVPCGGLCRSGVGTPIKGSSKASTSTADPLPLSLPRNREGETRRFSLMHGTNRAFKPSDSRTLTAPTCGLL